MGRLVGNERRPICILMNINMKTVRNVFQQICSFGNLYSAYLKARRGKRYRMYAVGFERRLEETLLQLRDDLSDGTYSPGAYRAFYIHEPKKRLISAAPFRDRVVHHAVIDVLEPLFDRSLISDTFACRRGKGTHAAIDRCQVFLKQYSWVLKCDIKKFFPSIDHQVLIEMLTRKISDQNVLRLLKVILRTSNPQESILEWFPGDDLFTPLERKRGIPIGNLTSQFFANYYLNGLDHFVKQELRCKGYVRYMDDFILFGQEKQCMFEWKDAISAFLDDIRLRLHPRKQEVFPGKNGAQFLGFHVYTTNRRLNPENIRKFKIRTHNKIQSVKSGNLTLQEFRQCMVSWIGHAGHGDTWRLRTSLFRKFKI